MSPRTRTLTSFTIVIGVLIVLHYLGWLAPVERLIRSFVNPLSSQVYQWSVTDVDGNTSTKNTEELYASYFELLALYQDSVVDAARLRQLEEENMLLREQASFVQEQSYSSVGARVIGKDIDPIGSTILVDKGAEDGIATGMPVIVGKGILVGLIHEVENNTATVLLLDDSQSKVGATVLGETRSIGLIEGGFGLSVQMNFIPQNEEINPGEIVVTSGLTTGIPQGLVIGTVEAVEQEAYQPFQRAIVDPSTNLDGLLLVSILQTVN